MSPRRRRLAALLGLSVLFAGACDREGTGPAELVIVPYGASFAEVTDSLDAHGLVGFAPAFRLYAKLKDAEHVAKAGTYRFRQGVGWDRVLDDLRAGRVVTQRLTLPEAWSVWQAAPRIANIASVPADSVLAILTDTASAVRLEVPGPTLEGYLYPATYTFPLRVPLDSVLEKLLATYRRVWTPARRALADSAGLSEREVVTLASIVEKEARVRSEMPRIASVYLNRLERGMLLQADPTVQYALGEHQQRLLYAHIDSVAEDPYNTYRHPGLPPGPIASPSALAIDAVLRPDTTDFLYFVAAPDGSHIFTRSLLEHNRAKLRVQRAAERSGAAAPDSLDRDSAGAPARPDGGAR
ncbi:MAG: endolytic transglycosylase MltG [Longimicrobiales bacterium]